MQFAISDLDFSFGFMGTLRCNSNGTLNRQHAGWIKRERNLSSRTAANQELPNQELTNQERLGR